MKGTLTPGKLADVLILSRNIFEISPSEISAVKVDVTILGGKVVFERRQ